MGNGNVGIEVPFEPKVWKPGVGKIEMRCGMEILKLEYRN